MKYEIELNEPNQITIGQFIEFSKARGDIAKASIATGKSRDDIGKFPIAVTQRIVEEFKGLIAVIQEEQFERIITLDGTEYGFEPNLSRLSTAAWADISHLEDLGRDERLHQVLAILYRPITQRWGVNIPRYRIEDYSKYKGDSMDNAELFLSITMSKALGVLGFFLSLQKDLQNSSEAMMMNRLKEATENMKKEICHT